jgi:hypothetical protein
VVELTRKLLGFFDLERAPVRSPGQPEEVDGACDEVGRGADCQAAEVQYKTKDPVHRSNVELVQLVPGDRFLAERCVGFAEQQENRFVAGGDGLFEAAFFGNVKVDVVVDIYTMGC